MNKADLIEAIVDHADLTKANAGRALEGFCVAISAAMKENEDVALVGFGTFSLKAREARTGRNPATGETIEIAASKSVGFKPGSGRVFLYATRQTSKRPHSLLGGNSSVS